MGKETRDELDEVMERALGSYGQAPLRAGLQERVLLRVRERAATRRFQQPAAWVLCGAVLALCLLFWTEPVRRVPVSENVRSVTLPAEVLTPRRLTNASLELPRRKLRARRVAEPKLAIFPTIAPPTAEEKALARLVAEHPDRIPPELIDRKGAIEPIQISAIEIKPLQ